MTPHRNRAKAGLAGAIVIGASAWGLAETAAADQQSTGRDIYNRSCVACHGSDGAGAMPEVPDLTEADGSLTKPDEVLLRSIVEGVAKPDSPLPMPPMGGDPELTEDGARLVLEFIRMEFGPRCAGTGACVSRGKE